MQFAVARSESSGVIAYIFCGVAGSCDLLGSGLRELDADLREAA